MLGKARLAGFGSLEQPDRIALEQGRDLKPERLVRFAKSVDNLAEHGLVDFEHLGKPVLANARLPQLQLQILVHRSPPGNLLRETNHFDIVRVYFGGHRLRE
jgi:hypothetical protein